MALPIKANDTQEGCNPIASNCVIWQGPDIPCIKLCKGDTISDVSAKLAERLCTILDYLDVSAYDLTCFNPICPSPRDFQELIQLIISRICAINDIPVTPGGGAGCPDCVVPVAQCLQRPDALGNITAALQLRDYVILIGNEICGITTSITSIELRVTSLETAVTDIQNNCCTGGTGGDLFMPASQCLGTGDGTPIIDYLVLLDAAFCSLQTTSGNTNDVNTALSYKCINGTDTLATGSNTFNSLPGWIESPTNIAQSVQDLWLIVCNQYSAINGLNQSIVDLQTTITNLQTQVNECCGATCADISWSVTWAVSPQGTDKTLIIPRFSGTIPDSFTYCDGATTVPVTFTDIQGNSAVWNIDLIGILNGTATVPGGGFVVENSTGLNAGSIAFFASIPTCFTNGSLTCQALYESPDNAIRNAALGCQSGGLQIVNNNGVNLNLAYTNSPLLASLTGGTTTYSFTITPNGCSGQSAATISLVNWQGPINNLILPSTTWVYGTPFPGPLVLADACSSFIVAASVLQSGTGGSDSVQCGGTIFNTGV
jgi:hypothetical protein